MSYSPSSIVASAQLLKNSGLDLYFINGILQSYNNAELPSLFGNVYANAVVMDNAYGSGTPNSSFVLTIGNSLLPGLIGTMPSAVTSYFGTSTLTNQIQTQVTTIFPGGDISAFIQNLTKCHGAVSMGGDLYRTAYQVSNANLETNLGDLATGGFGVVAKIPNQNLAVLGSQIKKFGTIVDFTKKLFKSQNIDITANSLPTTTVEELFNPIKFAIKLLESKIVLVPTLHDDLQAELNLPESGDAVRLLGDYIISYLTSNVENKFIQSKVKKILSTYTDSNILTNVKVAFDADELHVTSLADFLDPTICLPELGTYMDFENLGKIYDLLTATFNSIKNFKDAGEFYENLIDGPTNYDPSSIYLTVDMQAIIDALPIFTDETIGPTILDLIGVIAEGPISNAIISAELASTKVLTTSEGANIKTLLTTLASELGNNTPDDYTISSLIPSGYTLGNYKTDIEANMTALINNVSNEYIQEIVATTGTSFSNAAIKLKNENISLVKTGIDLTQVVTDDTNSLLTFGRSFGDLSKDPAIYIILKSLANPDHIGGQAILSHIEEIKNLDTMSTYGINSSNNLTTPPLTSISD